MLSMKRTSFQNQLETILKSQGLLEEFQNSQIFSTTVQAGSKPIMRVVKCHSLITCYYLSEEKPGVSDGPSVTVSVSESGKWRYLARHRKATFSRLLKAA